LRSMVAWVPFVEKGTVVMTSGMVDVFRRLTSEFTGDAQLYRAASGGMMG
jgi:hypothetical protein